MKENQEKVIKEVEMKLPGTNSVFEAHERIKAEQRERFKKFEEVSKMSMMNYQEKVHRKKVEALVKEKLINLRDEQQKLSQMELNEQVQNYNKLSMVNQHQAELMRQLA